MSVPTGGREGSSPLTRGKLSAVVAVTIGLGLIPAHAGKTLCVMCSIAVASGSSPLTRGKPSERIRELIDAGLIPAHAGKTLRPEP